MKEVHILKSLKHPNIPIIYDIEEDENYSYIIEEYFQGESLKAYRMRLSFLNEGSIVELTSQICDLIQYLHTLDKAILYLDLKPDNILIYEGKLKLLDFGAARYAAQYMEASCQLGTLGYMAPERLYNRADQRSDIYSIGCLLYFLLTGTLYQPSSITKKWTWILLRNHRFYKLIERCLKPVPSNRFHSVEELKRSLIKVRGNGEFNKENAVMSYSIAIAGTQERIGVTHIALALTSYLSLIHSNAIYIEWNSSGFLNQFVTFNSEVKRKDGYWLIRHMWMQKRKNWETDEKDKVFCFQVKDYGVLSTDNLQEFLSEKHKLVVAGMKSWEWRNSMLWRNKLCDCKDIIYLYNLASKEYMREKSNSEPSLELCVPYLHQLFYDSKSNHKNPVFDSVLDYVVKNQRKDGDSVS